MDNLTRCHYNIIMERDYLKLRGTEFQNWFSNLMEHCYPNDFIRVRPWGRIGDQKCDGYLQSMKMVFQVYAPNEMKASDAINKINDDFSGALLHWSGLMDKWTFVHNSHDGLSPEIIKELLNIQDMNRSLVVNHWGFVEICGEVFSILSESDFVSLFGPAPSDYTMTKIGFEELRSVLDTIKKQPISLNEDIQNPPADKIKINALSSDVETLLLAGFRKSAQVEKFFREWYDPTYGDNIASAFKKEYERLKANRLSPDEIFWGLQEFAGGAKRGTPEHESAVLAVLAYLFEECEIFERGARA